MNDDKNRKHNQSNEPKNSNNNDKATESRWPDPVASKYGLDNKGEKRG